MRFKRSTVYGPHEIRALRTAGPNKITEVYIPWFGFYRLTAHERMHVSDAFTKAGRFRRAESARPVVRVANQYLGGIPARQRAQSLMQVI